MKKQFIHFILAVSVLSFACGSVAFAHDVPDGNIGVTAPSKIQVFKDWVQKFAHKIWHFLRPSKKEVSTEVVPAVSTAISTEITSAGFIPKIITIQKGGTVTWTNKNTQPAWPASAFHPTHTVYPEFDSLKGFGTGESYSFTFDKVGSWKYHDHLTPAFSGTVNVVE